ncbi:MAG: hypothetical protein ACREBG_11620, partial [Pyrinomonadaceae bacterium]
SRAQGAGAEMRRAPNSACVIARLLNVEGFTDFVANGVEQYWRKKSGLTERQKRQIERLDKEVARIMASAAEGDRQIIGRFIGLHKKMSFDTGLRIGLMTLIFRLSEEMDAAFKREPVSEGAGKGTA